MFLISIIDAIGKMDFSNKLLASSGDDSDNDIITDFLSNQVEKGNRENINNNLSKKPVPIISVTPSYKYGHILEDTLNHIEMIRESLVIMKKSTLCTNPHACDINDLNNVKLNTNTSTSLPDLTQNAILSDRRKSCTEIDDLSYCTTKNSHKSNSLSSLESEEQDSIILAERRRSSRNSTGGISTHSLNEAELARDLERLTIKRLSAQVNNRLTLQKSISTPSIAPLRSLIDDRENDTLNNFSESEDDNNDDRSLLCVNEKSESNERRPKRKRGSLFFRKKKEKQHKTKSNNSDVYDTSGKEYDTMGSSKASQKVFSKNPSKKNSITTHHDDRDFGEGCQDNTSCYDDSPLIRDSYFDEIPVTAYDLSTDSILGIALNEPDSWTPNIEKEILKTIKDKEIKRQEHIYEFIMTEKHHCQTLLVIKKIFVEGIQKHVDSVHTEKLFPRLDELIELHTIFLKNLRLKQKNNYIIDSIADIILDFFGSNSALQLKNVYGEFCSNHRNALDKFKYYLSDITFTNCYKHCLSNPLLKKKGIPECILFVTQRLTKYPLLIDSLIKSSIDDKIETDKLRKSLHLVKTMLIDVDACVAEKEKQDRQFEIFRKIDVKSVALYKNKYFKKSEIIGLGSNKKLKFEGHAILLQGRSKIQPVVVVVLTDCLFFLQENSHNKYSFFTPENKAGVVSLQKLLIREKAGTDSCGIYIISSQPDYPEMYELKVQQPKDKNIWIKSIREAVVECPQQDNEVDILTTEEKEKLIKTKQANIRDLIASKKMGIEAKLHQIDMQHAIILEEKIRTQLDILKENRSTSKNSQTMAEDFFKKMTSYKELLGENVDSTKILENVLMSIHDISQLASSLYTAATGLPVSRSISSVGEKQSETFASPILPKRAETFSGFDDKRKSSPWKDAILSTFPILNASNTHKGTIMNVNTENICMKDSNLVALEIAHNLHTLLCIICQQMTKITDLEIELESFCKNEKCSYKDQLEELRNLQDKLQEEKNAWMKQKEQQENELEQQRSKQEETQKQMKMQQEDIKEQREQLYRKMEMLSMQGLLLSPNTPIAISNKSFDGIHDENNTIVMSPEDNKSKTQAKSCTISKPTTLRQQIPVKLSSTSKLEKDQNIPQLTSSTNSNSSGLSQLLPLKLADKKNAVIPNHSRTGSTPSSIPVASQIASPATSLHVEK
ncbi:hypothetical protein ACFFRR_009568 [Megaselia abdita]